MFHYDKWSDTVLPKLAVGQTFKPSELKMSEGQTTAPQHLQEADLIDKMDKNGIGTDATIHEHIANV